MQLFSSVTFRSYFYLVSTVVFCKCLLHFMFLVYFTIAFLLCNLVSDYGILRGSEKMIEFFIAVVIVIVLS